MERQIKSRSPKWWSQHEGRLRGYISLHPDAQLETFDDLYQGIGRDGLGGPVPKAELRLLCRLLDVKLGGLP